MGVSYCESSALLTEKPSVIMCLYFNLPMTVLLLDGFFSLSHLGKESHFLSSCSCYPLLFWHRCPKSLWVSSSKLHELLRQEMWRENPQFMADLYCWLRSLLCTLRCRELPLPRW